VAIQKHRVKLILYVIPALIVSIVCAGALLLCVDVIGDYASILHDEGIPLTENVKHVTTEAYVLYLSIITVGFVSLVLVVTNARNAHNNARHAAELSRLNNVLENRLAAMELSLDGILTVDKDGILRYMNKCLMELLQIRAEDQWKYIDLPWDGLFPEDVFLFLQDNALEALDGKGTWVGEYALHTNDKTRIIELSLTRLPDGGFVGTNRDVTDRKHHENERQALQNQFYQAQKMEAIGRLAGGVAHDFNNILAAINGYTGFLIEDLDDRPDEQKFAQKIMAATQQAKKLVDQILTFSRRNDTAEQIVDVVDVLHENISMIQASSMSSIDIQEKRSLDSAYVQGNATQVSQAIMNLCVNALDAMEDKHGVLKVEVKSFDPSYLRKLGMIEAGGLPQEYSPIVRIEDGKQSGQTLLMLGSVEQGQPYVCLSIADTGSGITREVMENVFEPFFTTKAIDKGTGLGLSTVQGVVVQHRGAMVIDSIVGLGTRFNLFFPIAKNIVEETAAEVSTQEYIQFDDTRVLLVEDQDTVRDMMEKMLQRMDLNVISVPNGARALEVLRSYQETRPFDLIITDHAMPHMTGLELAQECSSLFPDLPFIIASGYSREKLQQCMHDYPSIKAVLRKPVGKEDMKNKIYEALGGVVDDDQKTSMVSGAMGA